ncbi:TPA: hypothetical protein N0F65_006351 [Lagenidium giganteum]|uniref:Complex 1 LYR protein domain-containing protein n=1 Tax=Lagenidium giganteum TaxID=4803 RepID=A0AAV2YE85_9STRA|nr:TPA: hypothetical protein N0F65_006351 [Lagenidium giganteum]
MRDQVLALYRQVVRVAKAFPEHSVGKKLQYNARELIRVRQREDNPKRIQRFVDEGYAVLDVYALLAVRPTLLQAITRKPQQLQQQQQPVRH